MIAFFARILSAAFRLAMFAMYLPFAFVTNVAVNAVKVVPTAVSYLLGSNGRTVAMLVLAVLLATTAMSIAAVMFNVTGYVVLSALLPQAYLLGVYSMMQSLNQAERFAKRMPAFLAA